MVTLVAVACGYLLGSIPFALLLTRSRGVDLRAAGSRNVGAANVLRTAGVTVAVAVLLLDAAKGAAAVLIARAINADILVATTAGMAAIAGHIYPPWLGFRGGKGVAAAAGAFSVLAPTATAIAVAVFVAAVFITRFISAGSIAGAITLPIAAAVGNVAGPVVAGAIVSAILVVYRHRDNLSRLFAGTERRIGLRL